MFALDANSVGNHILEIEYKIGNASFVQAEDSPIVIAVRACATLRPTEIILLCQRMVGPMLD